MAPRPIANRLSEPFEITSIATDLPGNQGLIRGDTPSPPSSSSPGSPSPPPSTIVPSPLRTIIPNIATNDGLPYDHTLPEYIRQVSGQASLTEVESMSLRVLTETASLQRMSFYTPNLRELNLEGSALMSLRDIGCELHHLQVLRVSRCQLTSLDGSMGLRSLRELYASRNIIKTAAPCAHLPKLRFLDLSRNQIQDTSSLGFLTLCSSLRSIYLNGNPLRGVTSVTDFIRRTLPIVEYLDGVNIRQDGSREEGDIGTADSGSDEASSRISSAGSGIAAVPWNISSLDDNGSIDYDALPSSSHETSVSVLTSGQILSGNLTAIRRRQSLQGGARATTGICTSSKILDAAMMWRRAYHLLREGRNKILNGSSSEQK